MTLPAHVQRLLDIYDSKDPVALKGCLTDTYQWIGTNNALDRENMLHLLDAYFTAFPDWAFNFRDARFEKEVLSVTIAPTGTHQHALDLTQAGIDVHVTPTGRSIALAPRQIDSTLSGGQIASQHIEMVEGRGVLREVLAALGIEEAPN